MATRHQVRQGVVSLLYSYEFNNTDEEFIEEFLQEKKIRNRQKEFTISLFKGVMENLKNIDEKISLFLKEYSLSEIGSVERAILRLGAYELLYTNTDDAIIINEGIELCKDLCADSSSKLINGVLDAIKEQK